MWHRHEAAEQEDAGAFFVGQALRGIGEEELFFVFADVEQVIENVAAEDLEDALAKGRHGGDMEEFPVVVAELEGLVGMGEGIVGDEGGDVGEFGLIGAEELLAGGDVEEEIANGDDGAIGKAGFVAANHLAAVNFNDTAGGFFRRVGLEREAGDAGDGGQRFAAETERGDGEEVFDARQFRGGVALEGEHGVIAQHAAAVIGDTEQAAAAGLGFDGDGGGTGVERIFEEFLDDGGGPLDDFAGGNLIRNGVREDANSAHFFECSL